MSRKALGRGMSALLGEDSTPEDVKDDESVISLRELDIDEIVPNPHQPRQSMDENALDELANSIREKGIIQPLLVRAHPSQTGRFQIIAGERRYQAAKKAGLRSVPAIVQEATDEELLELALIENIQREDLDVIEEAHAYKMLSERFHLNQDVIATRVGKARSTIANTLRLLDLDLQLQERLRDGSLTPGHARALLSLDDEKQRTSAAKHVMQLRMNVRQCEDYVARILKDEKPLARAKPRKARQSAGVSDPAFSPLEKELIESLGTKVAIRRIKDQQGIIEIEFYDDDQLSGLVERLIRGRRF